MLGNATFEDHSLDWLLCNRTLIEGVVKNLCESLGVRRGVRLENQARIYQNKTDHQKKDGARQ